MLAGDAATTVAENRDGVKGRPRGDDLKGTYGRWGAALYIGSGLVGWISALLQQAAGLDATAAWMVNVVSIVIGVVAWFLPWSRWPRWTGLLFVPPGFALIALYNVLIGDPGQFAIFFIVVFAWIGLAQPRGSSVKFAPLAALAHVAPYVIAGRYDIDAAVETLYVVTASVLVGETLAWVSQRLTMTREALDEEAPFRPLVQHASDVIVAIDRHGKIRYISPSIALLTGRTDEELRGVDIYAHVHPEDHERLRAAFESASRTHGLAPPLELRYRHADGSWRWIEARVNNLLFDPTVGAMVITARDVSERRAVEDALRAAEMRYRMLVEQMPVVTYVITNADNDSSLYWSPQIEALVGYAPAEFVANPRLWRQLVHPDDRDRVIAEHYRTNATGNPFRIEYRLVARDGHVVWVRDEAVLIPDETGALRNWQGVMLDITEEKRLENQMAFHAYHDVLTGLPNRALLFQRLDTALRNASRVALVFIDLDNFKLVNDSFGHLAGDRVLKLVGERLQGCLRATDLIARLGGDEFTVLLDAPGGVGDAVVVADRVQAALAEPFDINANEVFITASIGIVVSDPSLRHPEDVLQRADVALYHAKRTGKARFAVYESAMNEATRGRLELERDLRRALDRREFVVYYQPVVDLRTGQVREVEALVRWRHPTRGLISPAEFIPVAEEVGLIVPLGRWVMEEAVRQARAWQERFALDPPLAVAVNISARQWAEPGLDADIERVVSEAQLEPSRLKLEITESLMMDETETTIERLRRLKALGVQFVVDDFGTGYSSLSYLKRFPVDSLKVDRAFVSGLGSAPEDRALVEAILAAARALHLTVTAEGIETTEQLTHLHALGCDSGQGYYFSEPKPAEWVSELLAQTHAYGRLYWPRGESVKALDSGRGPHDELATVTA